MQRKTIEKTISNKIKDWFKSIEDQSLTQKLKKEILVSGGCITSLLTNETVNDFDIYIKTPETAFELAKYYTRNFQNIKPILGKDKSNYMDGQAEYLYASGIRKHFFENLKEEQVKLWLEKEAGFRTSNIDEGLNKFVPLYFSANAISLSDKIQVVLRFTGDHHEIHKNFDFIHATNYWTFDDGLVTNTKALESIMSKQLYYQGSYYPITSIIRTKKFLKRNWNISAGEQLKMMWQVSNLDLTNFAVLEEQLAGVDVAYFGLLIDILADKMEKDPLFTFSYEYVKVLIDKIFNAYDEESDTMDKKIIEALDTQNSDDLPF